MDIAIVFLSRTDYYSRLISNPLSVSILRSISVLFPDVVSMSPVMVAFEPEKNACFPHSCIR